jgi:hypothetical protein
MTAREAVRDVARGGCEGDDREAQPLAHQVLQHRLQLRLVLCQRARAPSGGNHDHIAWLKCFDGVVELLDRRRDVRLIATRAISAPIDVNRQESDTESGGQSASSVPKGCVALHSGLPSVIAALQAQPESDSHRQRADAHAELDSALHRRVQCLRIQFAICGARL